MKVFGIDYLFDSFDGGDNNVRHDDERLDSSLCERNYSLTFKIASQAQ